MHERAGAEYSREVLGISWSSPVYQNLRIKERVEVWESCETVARQTYEGANPHVAECIDSDCRKVTTLRVARKARCS